MGQEIKILQIVSITMLGLLFILFLYLIVRKTIEIKENKYIQQKVDQLKMPIIRYLQWGKEMELESIELSEKRLDKVALEKILSHFSEMIEGTEEENRLQKIANLYLKSYYLKNLQAWSWSKRMNVLYKIEDFHMEELEEAVVQKLNGSRKISVEEKIQIYRILSSFQYEAIVSLLIQDESLTEKEYRSMLIRLNMDLFHTLLSSFSECREALQLAILDVMSLRKKIDHIDFLENTFHMYSGEVRVRALKAISSVGFVSNIAPYITLSHSTVWEERMMLAKLLGITKNSDYLPILRELIHDSSWWVRSQAAESIIKYKQGKEVLQDILDYSKDVFAKDMALEWLNKGAIE